MKKTIAFLLAVALILALPACGAKQSEAGPPEGGEVPAVIEKPGPVETTAPTEAVEETPAASEAVGFPEEPPVSAAAETVDVDLTQLSSTMVYSEVYAMVYEPEQYMGKTVKMRGLFSSFEGTAGQMYYACIVQDATACCAQGLEFELTDGCDYPEPGTEITVIGTFDTYREEYNGNYYAGGKRHSPEYHAVQQHPVGSGF